jgi:hypothetical protein
MNRLEDILEKIATDQTYGAGARARQRAREALLLVKNLMIPFRFEDILYEEEMLRLECCRISGNPTTAKEMYDYIKTQPQGKKSTK